MEQAEPADEFTFEGGSQRRNAEIADDLAALRGQHKLCTPLPPKDFAERVAHNIMKDDEARSMIKEEQRNMSDRIASMSRTFGK
eukprot:gene36646-24593_t